MSLVTNPGTPTQVNGVVSGVIQANSGNVLTLSGFPANAKSWSVALVLNNGQYSGVGIGYDGYPSYVTTGQGLFVSGITLNDGTMSIYVENASSTDDRVTVQVSGMVM